MGASRFNLVLVAQGGRLAYEAALLVASLRRFDPDFPGRVFIAMPEKGPRWARNPEVQDTALLDLYARLGAETLRFPSVVFGSDYPHGNKIECLAHLPEGEPFLFLDSDTLVLEPLSGLDLDFTRPSASMRVRDTWPDEPLYGPKRREIWQALYRRFDLDFAASCDPAYPESDYRHYLYFNAGWFYGPCPVAFGRHFLSYAKAIREDAPEELADQSLDPWLDQVALPLVISRLGGGRPLGDGLRLDGQASWHWRVLPLLYASAPDHVLTALQESVAPNFVKKVLRGYEPFLEMIWKKKGEKVRRLFPLGADGLAERIVRKTIKDAGLWMR